MEKAESFSWMQRVVRNDLHIDTEINTRFMLSLSISTSIYTDNKCRTCKSSIVSERVRTYQQTRKMQQSMYKTPWWRSSFKDRYEMEGTPLEH